jgi:outer membrane protein OmpA-like peptidoglycan-associated protein
MSYSKSSTSCTSIATLAVTLALVTACASQPEQNAQLEQARLTVASVQSDPLAPTAAGVELEDARNSLMVAENAWLEGEDSATVRYHAYMATGYAEIARARTDDARMRQQIDDASARTSDIVLSARDRELEALRAKQTERGAVLTLGDVLFDTDKAQLKPGAHTTIDRLAAWLHDNPGNRILVEGHTDSRGSDGYNQNLSQRRADAVAYALYSDGITHDRISVKGLGEAYPVASNGTSAGQQQNRRVEVVISDANGEFPMAAMR